MANLIFLLASLVPLSLACARPPPLQPLETRASFPSSDETTTPRQFCDEPDGEIVVIGERSPTGRSVKMLTELARREFSKQASNCSILSPDDTLRLIGFVPSDLSPAREALNRAERYRATGHPGEARQEALSAVGYLVRSGGSNEAWQLIRRGSSLLACLSLEEGTAEGAKRASHDLLSLAIVRPNQPPDPLYCGRFLAGAFQQALAKAATLERGRLHIDIQPLIVASATIWIDGVPADTSDNAAWDGIVLKKIPTHEIELAEGTYNLVVTHGKQAPSRSLSRTITIHPNTDNRFSVELDMENTVDPEGGPSIGPASLGPPYISGTSLIAKQDGHRRWVAIEYSREGLDTWVSLAVYIGPSANLEWRAETKIVNDDEASAVELLVLSAISRTSPLGVIVSHRSAQ